MSNINNTTSVKGLAGSMWADAEPIAQPAPHPTAHQANGQTSGSRGRGSSRYHNQSPRLNPRQGSRQHPSMAWNSGEQGGKHGNGQHPRQGPSHPPRGGSNWSRGRKQSDGHQSDGQRSQQQQPASKPGANQASQPLGESLARVPAPRHTPSNGIAAPRPLLPPTHQPSAEERREALQQLSAFNSDLTASRYADKPEADKTSKIDNAGQSPKNQQKQPASTAKEGFKFGAWQPDDVPESFRGSLYAPQAVQELAKPKQGVQEAWEAAGTSAHGRARRGDAATKSVSCAGSSKVSFHMANGLVKEAAVELAAEPVEQQGAKWSDLVED